MRVRFWGTRGSIPKPGPTTLRYGGNTSCVEVRADDGTLVVLDCGTGAHELGARLARQNGRVRGNLLIGHTHWDHIQGFPFFGPLFAGGGEWDVFAPGGHGRQLERTLSGQMSYEYSPITLDSLHARVQFHDLAEGTLRIGSIRVTCQYMNHPALTLGYRLEADGASVVYATDHEPHSLHPLDGEPGEDPIHHEDRRHVRFLADADLVIHDSQYLLSEFPEKTGWGHSPMERVVDYAIRARARQVALYHHDPFRDDHEIDRICEVARERAAGGGEPVPAILGAAEGLTLELRGDAPPREDPALSQAALLSSAPRRAQTVLVVDDDRAMREVLETALHSEGVRVLTADGGTQAVEATRRERPSLLLVDRTLPDGDGLDVCRALRGEADPRLRDVPILVLTGTRRKEVDVVEAFTAGATDYLTKPIKPTLVRSRVRGWLMRTGS